MSPAVIRFLEEVVYRREDPLARIIKVILIGLSGIYKAAIWVYLLPFELGFRRREQLTRPVISVGNITVGGTGKSPMVQYLCRGLNRRGLMPAVLSYGYGGSLNGKFGIVSDRKAMLLTPSIAGDEPAMLAASLPGTPVLVCKDRLVSGEAAIKELEAEVLVLDDGFQVWKLDRDLDIVLINGSNPFDNGHTLPAGRLREPLSALRRADCFVATGEWEPEEIKDMIAQVPADARSAPLFFARFQPTGLVAVGGSSDIALSEVAGKKVLGLCSIANPASFEQMLAGLGVNLVACERFPDHHAYTPKDIADVNSSAVESSAELIVTTDKDAIKLDAHQLAIPVYSLRIRAEMDDETGFWELVMSRLGNDAD